MMMRGPRTGTEILKKKLVRLDEAGGEVALIAMRAGDLSPQRRKQVRELLDPVYRLEQTERADTSNA